MNRFLKGRKAIHWLLPLAFAMVMLLGVTVTVNAEGLNKAELFVGGKDIVDEGGIVSDGSGGTAVLLYDDDNPVLTLTNYNYSGKGYDTGGWNIGIYYKANSPLTIQLKGNNSITIADGNREDSSGIYI